MTTIRREQITETLAIRVVKDAEWNEFRVEYVDHRRVIEARTYFTNDKDDAVDTFWVIVKDETARNGRIPVALLAPDPTPYEPRTLANSKRTDPARINDPRIGTLCRDGIGQFYAVLGGEAQVRETLAEIIDVLADWDSNHPSEVTL